MGLMDGKVCVVTGGAGSLGLASAAAFVGEGGKVMLVDRDDDKLAAAAKSLGGGDNVATCAANVSESGDVKRYVDETVAKWGKIDVLFSNAGIVGDIKPIHMYPEEVFDAVMAVNVKASYLACHHAVPHMNEGGSIIFTSSIVGFTSDPGIVGYATSKHALVGLMRTVAKELAPQNIRANIIAPGPIDNSFQLDVEDRLGKIVGRDGTEFLNEHIPMGRHGSPEEVAKMVLFLASDQSSFSTGSVFHADGGMNV